MLSSITPLGERGRGNRWGTTATFFVIASTLGGAATGGLLGLLGTLLPLPWRARAGLAVVLAVAALAFDARDRPPPRTRRQVDERWLDGFRSWVYGGGFGIQLGAGLATIATSASTYLVFALALVLGPWGVAVGTAFGLGRGLTILTARSITSAVRLRLFHSRLHARRRAAGILVVAAEVGLVVAGTACLAVRGW